MFLSGQHWEPEVLCTEIMPYLQLTNPTLHDTGNILDERKHSAELPDRCVLVLALAEVPIDRQTEVLGWLFFLQP